MSNQVTLQTKESQGMNTTMHAEGKAMKNEFPRPETSIHPGHLPKAVVPTLKGHIAAPAWGRGLLRVLLILPVLALGSCVSGPNYKRPAINTPGAYKSAAESEKADHKLGLDWWRAFQDSELDALVTQAIDANQGLKAAAARVAQARASAASVKSSFFPVVTMDASATRTRTPAPNTSSGSNSDSVTELPAALNKVAGIIGQVNTLTQGGTSTGTTSLSSSYTTTAGVSATTSNSFRVPFDLSYEVDIWGRVQRSYEAAQAQTRAAVYDLEVVRQTLIADLARDYFSIRSLDAQELVINRNLALYQEQVELTRNQFKAGLVEETNALQAEVQLESTRVQAMDTRRQRTDLEHAIAILLGKAPAEFSLPTRGLDAVPPTIPAGLPGDLLRRRPDVAEAEQNLVAASAQIGVAQADFFPTVRLTGSAGFQSSELENALSMGNGFWSIGPSVSLPIFKGGQLKASLAKAKARYDELEATYKNSVLAAFADVEDSLTDLHLRADEAQAQDKAVAAAREYLWLTHLQYQTGVLDYLKVINAEQTLLTNELSQAKILNERMASTVLLMKALGGGWDAQPVNNQ